MKSRASLAFASFVVGASMAGAAIAEEQTVGASTLERGRYLVQVGGCNDCHTPGYPESGGQLPEAQWLTGTPVGFSGPWGTSYPANLRLSVARMSEQQFLARSRAPMLPPMPWYNLRDMAEDDLVAVYRYIRSLGPAGVEVPAPLAAGERAATPTIVFVPQGPGELAASGLR